MKEKTIEEIEDFLFKKAKEISEDKNISSQNKYENMKICWNIFYFLKNYDKNVEILNKNTQDKNFLER